MPCTSDTWACVEISPGITNLPVTSMVRAPVGGRTLPTRPTPSILPSRTTMTEFGTTGAPVPSMRAAPLKTIGDEDEAAGVGDCCGDAKTTAVIDVPTAHARRAITFMDSSASGFYAGPDIESEDVHRPHAECHLEDRSLAASRRPLHRRGHD